MRRLTVLRFDELQVGDELPMPGKPHIEAIDVDEETGRYEVIYRGGSVEGSYDTQLTVVLDEAKDDRAHRRAS